MNPAQLMAIPFLSAPPRLGERSCLGILPPLLVLYLLPLLLCPRLLLKHHVHIKEYLLEIYRISLPALTSLNVHFPYFPC